MRKLISVLTIAVLVLALAAPNSPTLPSGGVTEVTPTVGDAVDPVTGEKVDVVVSEPKLEAGETLQSVAEDALKAAKEAGAPVENATAAEVFDIDMKDGTQPDGSVQVTIVREKDSGEVAAIMYQAEDGTWDKAEFTQYADGTVVVTFKHFCTVVLLMKEATQAPDVKPTPKPESGSTGSTGSTGSSSEPTSPQTGYDCA